MVWNKGFANRRGTEVLPYFRLPASGQHLDGCELNFKTFMDGLRSTPDSGISRRNKKYHLRLPNEALGNNLQRTSDAVQTRSNAPSWAETFTAATSIARFLRHFEGDPDFLNELQIDYLDGNGNPFMIEWRDFCFDAEDERAVRKHAGRLASESYARQFHPVAVQMTLEVGWRTTINGSRQRIFRNTSASIAVGDVQRPIQFAAYSDSSFTQLAAGDTVLVLGYATISDHTMNTVRELQFDIAHEWQIAKLN